MNSLDKDTESAVRDFISRLPASCSVVGVIVFGSRARQDHRSNSDADVAVILEGSPMGRTNMALAMADIAFEVMMDTQILIEAIPIWVSEWQAPADFSNPSLIENIKRQGIRI